MVGKPNHLQNDEFFGRNFNINLFEQLDIADAQKFPYIIVGTHCVFVPAAHSAHIPYGSRITKPGQMMDVVTRNPPAATTAEEYREPNRPAAHKTKPQANIQLMTCESFLSPFYASARPGPPFGGSAGRDDVKLSLK